MDAAVTRNAGVKKFKPNKTQAALVDALNRGAIIAQFKGRRRFIFMPDKKTTAAGGV